MRSALALVVLATSLASGCMTASRWVEVEVKDTQRVDVTGVADKRVKREERDVTVDGKSALAFGTHVGRGRATVVQPVQTVPDKLAIREGRYTWRRGDATLSTPTENIARAELATLWTQPLGEVPSLGAMVVGGLCVIGFGVTGGVMLGEGIQKDQPDDVTRGAVYIGLGAAGAGLFAYGLATWLLIKNSPYWDPLPIEAPIEK